MYFTQFLHWIHQCWMDRAAGCWSVKVAKKSSICSTNSGCFRSAVFSFYPSPRVVPDGSWRCALQFCGPTMGSVVVVFLMCEVRSEVDR